MRFIFTNKRTGYTTVIDRPAKDKDRAALTAMICNELGLNARKGGR